MISYTPVAVTCTKAGSTGLDQEVGAQLGLGSDVEKRLLHGVWCAGVLAALGAAALLNIGEAWSGCVSDGNGFVGFYIGKVVAVIIQLKIRLITLPAMRAWPIQDFQTL